MKRSILLVALALTATSTLAGTYVHGHTRSNGTYVQPYVRSSPNSTTLDNYSTQGNTNPYTRREGTVNPYPQQPQYQQQPIQPYQPQQPYRYGSQNDD